MNGRILELKVGIFIFIAVIVLFIIVFSIGDIFIFEKTYRINVIFGFANGLAESAPVRLAGVDVGEVEKIEVFYDEEGGKTKVLLYARIAQNKKIEKDAQASINTLGLLGEKYLEISPGTAEAGFLTDGDTIMGRDPIAVEALTRDMRRLVDSATVIVDRLKDGEGTVGKLLVEEKIYNDLEALVEDIKVHPWKLLHKVREKKREKEDTKDNRDNKGYIIKQ